ncbi:unnamed protein product [Prunus armeniaca]
MSNAQRVKMRLSSDSSCSYSGWYNEDALHILRDCSKAKELWSQFLIPSQFSKFFEVDFKPWLMSNLCSSVKWYGCFPWIDVFVFTYWYLWKWRNQHIFSGDDSLPLQPIQIIVVAVFEWFKAFDGTKNQEIKEQQVLSWEPHISNWLKLNVDGSRRGMSGDIGAGGLIRDSVGIWHGGFVVNLGQNQILEAELWGLFFGLKLAIGKGVKKLLVEMDSATTVRLIQCKESLEVHPFAGLLDCYREMWTQLDCVKVHHIFQEKNFAADCLAKLSYNMGLVVWFLDEAPNCLGSIFIDDSLGVCHPRMV